MLAGAGEAVYMMCIHDVRNRISHSRKIFGDVSENLSVNEQSLASEEICELKSANVLQNIHYIVW